MLRRLPSLMVVLLLVGQGLLAAPALWHHHGSPQAEEHGCCHAGHRDVPADEPAPVPAEDDDCAVCLALSVQRIALTAPTFAVAPAPLVGRLEAVAARAPVITGRGPRRSRGPPAFNLA